MDRLNDENDREEEEEELKEQEDKSLHDNLIIQSEPMPAQLKTYKIILDIIFTINFLMVTIFFPYMW